MQQASSHLRGLVAARAKARSQGLEAESIRSEEVLDAEPPHPDEVLQSVKDVMDRIPEAEIENPDDFQRALHIFMTHADRAVQKLNRDPAAPLNRNESFALEAVIRTDGTRPSLLVRGGTVDPKHPLAGGWHDTLMAVKDSLRERVAAVGRIEPANPSSNNFFGTGWLVDADQGLVLTNLHVLEAMWSRLPNAMLRGNDGSYQVLPGAAFIDFAGESGSLVKNRFPIEKAIPSGIDGSGFSRLDLAVMKIKTTDQSGAPSATLPVPIPVVADTEGPQGNLSSFCVVGFPGPPPFTSGVHEGVDWIWVNTTLFGGRFGVKRLAPGQAHRALGSLDGDPKQWVFGHDATTLGGSSGSPVLAWLDSDKGGFGLHFAGASVDTNCAHAIVQFRDRLQELGVPVQDPR
ncbi:MAG TPA: trypsin-like peptidase domain-containing protein [Thermoanaerobaculia bacterium]|nr:trypsin-like peptidase domain-containing protein [Thermoanaerobaculia bacterium]